MADARYKPMLATPADGFPADLSGWVQEPKWDGWRALVVIEDTGVTLIGGRNSNTYTGKAPYIENALAGALPAGTVIDGELISMAKGWGGVQSVMTGRHAHRPSAADPALTFVAFDILSVKGNELVNLPWHHRREVLEMISWPEHTQLTPNGPASEEAHLKFLDLGMEGSMLKNQIGIYAPGRRSETWLKLKAIATEDLTIVGFEDGKNGRAGEVGAIVVGLPNGQTTTASGMTDKVRADMQANPGNYLGKVAEIAHNGVMASGKLRHPRFKRMRDDKTPVAPKPKVSSSGTRRAGSARMRNYKRMGDAKLMGCVNELSGGYGDAYQRATADANFSPREHFIAAQAAAIERGFSVPAFSK